MKSLLVIPLFLLGVCDGADPVYTKLYAGKGSSGLCVTLKENAKSLHHTIDNKIKSVKGTGLWLYYENVNYNEKAGKIYYVHGIHTAVDFPPKYCNIVSSVRNVPSLLQNDRDMITFYDGEDYAGKEFSTPADKDAIGDLTGKVSSLIVTGRNPWTVYSGASFTGRNVCVFPSISSNPDSKGQVIDLGFYPDMTSVGLADGEIKSVKRLCHSHLAGKWFTLKEDGHHKNGTWGPIV